MKEVIRFKELKDAVGLSRSTVWRMERAGTFPARVQLSRNSVGWYKADVDAWLRSRAMVVGVHHG